MHDMIKALVKRLQDKYDKDNGFQCYHEETIYLMLQRWKKLDREFYDAEKDRFDLTKVPDVHDNIRYDALHNGKVIDISKIKDLYTDAKNFADCVVTQEYGQTPEEKAVIGTKICHQLIDKIKDDILFSQQGIHAGDFRHMVDESQTDDYTFPSGMYGHTVRTRLYFTSESHIHGLMNALCYAVPPEDCPLSIEAQKRYHNTPELCYLTHLVIRVFEDMNKNEDDPTRFRIEILFSPGADQNPLVTTPTARWPFQGKSKSANLLHSVAPTFPLVAASFSSQQFDKVMQAALEKADNHRSNTHKPEVLSNTDPTTSIADISFQLCSEIFNALKMWISRSNESPIIKNRARLTKSVVPMFTFFVIGVAIIWAACIQNEK